MSKSKYNIPFSTYSQKWNDLHLIITDLMFNQDCNIESNYQKLIYNLQQQSIIDKKYPKYHQKLLLEQVYNKQ